MYEYHRLIVSSSQFVLSLSETIRPGIPEVTLQTNAGENFAHLVRLRAARAYLQAG